MAVDLGNTITNTVELQPILVMASNLKDTVAPSYNLGPVF